mgnify:CR=1 FL=1
MARRVVGRLASFPMAPTSSPTSAGLSFLDGLLPTAFRRFLPSGSNRSAAPGGNSPAVGGRAAGAAAPSVLPGQVPATAVAPPTASRPGGVTPGSGAGGATNPSRPGAPLGQRSVDGSGNNPNRATLNATGSTFGRIGPARFSDGAWAMVNNLPNARTISNLVVAGQGVKANQEGLSGMMYAWGQFIDHDLTLTLSDESTSIAIPVPAGDPQLSGSIPMTRAIIDPLTGVAGKPAAAVNHVSGWLDGSMVYGSDASTAAALRSSDGSLLTSPGGNLPLLNGSFQAGDIRAQENPDLTALQVLFVREHNRLVNKLRLAHPAWSGDQLYQQARTMVTAEIARITYNEFLPHLLGANTPAPYQGYRSTVDASLSVEFSGAAFRFGHSIVSANLEKIDEQGNTIGTPVSLRDAFFQTPEAFSADGGADALLRHLGADLSNAMDVHLVDDLRNFLFGPGMGLDLAALNIQRGRDLGLASLNDTRRALGLKPYSSFNAITSDKTTAAALQAAYGSVERVELWIGGLAEDHVGGGMVGQTFATIIGRQFQALRDGDRYWYQNLGLDRDSLKEIESTSLSQLILRNTNTQHLQDDVFMFMERRAGQLGGGVMQDANAPQLVVGSDDGDVITGGNRNDLLVAGRGRQTMTGGRGADRFIFSQGGIQATILDFKPGEDRLQFEGLGSAANPQAFEILRGARDTVVVFGGDRITLQGLAGNAFRPADISVL